MYKKLILFFLFVSLVLSGACNNKNKEWTLAEASKKLAQCQIDKMELSPKEKSDLQEEISKTDEEAAILNKNCPSIDLKSLTELLRCSFVACDAAPAPIKDIRPFYRSCNAEQIFQNLSEECLGFITKKYAPKEKDANFRKEDDDAEKEASQSIDQPSTHRFMQNYKDFFMCLIDKTDVQGDETRRTEQKTKVLKGLSMLEEGIKTHCSADEIKKVTPVTACLAKQCEAAEAGFRYEKKWQEIIEFCNAEEQSFEVSKDCSKNLGFGVSRLQD